MKKDKYEQICNKRKDFQRDLVNFMHYISPIKRQYENDDSFH